MENIFSERCKEVTFDPADPPYGSRNYDTDILEPERKEKLKQQKIALRRENEAYLHNHPEIRGLISITLRHMLEKKPSRGEEAQELCAAFFGRPRRTIAAELLDYLLEIKHQGAIVKELREEVAGLVEKPLDSRQ